MSIIEENIDDVFHRIQVRLFPNNFPIAEGRYIARADNEASLSVERICAKIKNRGGFLGNYEYLTETIKQFLDECAYLLCDGFSLDLGCFSVHPGRNPVNDPSKAVKVTRIGENTSSIVTGIAPDTQYQNNRIEIRTQYSGPDDSFLEAPRSIVSDFALDKVN